MSKKPIIPQRILHTHAQRLHGKLTSLTPIALTEPLSELTTWDKIKETTGWTPQR